MKRFVIYLLTLGFLAVAGVCGWYTASWHGDIGITVRVPGQEGWEEIRCWEGEEDTYYLFLPAYADMSQVRLYTNVRNTVYLNDRKIKGGMTCGEFPLDTEMSLVYMSKGKRHEYTLQFRHSANTAAMYLDVASGSMDYIHALKGNEETAQMRLYTSEGMLDFSGSLESVKGRGNDSWGKNKKPYSLKLGASADLLGMGQAQKWVLFANYSDPTHLRNKLVYDLAQELGLSYSPQCQWVDLYLNSEYAGLYLLSERNEVHPQRVAVAETDSFLVSMEPGIRLEEQAHPHVATASGIAFRVRETAFSEEAMARILQSVDNAIHAEDGIDPETGKHWREWIDMDSWAQKYLIEEVFANLDANAASQFYYYVGNSTQGKLYAGPVWDYDLSMGSHKIWQTAATDALFGGSPHIWSEEDHPWMAAMLRHPEFRDRVLELYRKTFLPQLQPLVETGIDAYAAQIEAAARMNRIRWQSEDFDEHVALVKGYLRQRLQFLNSYWLEQEQYHLVTVNLGTGANIACYAVRPGQTLTQFPEERAVSGGDNYGWHRTDTDEVFDLSQPIYGDADIYLKWYPVEAPAAEETEAAEEIYDEAYWEEPEEEPLSLLRLGPAMVFMGMLVLFCGIGLRSCQSKKKKEAVHN